MADVLLSTVDLDVFGGPTSVDVSVDFGQTGERGSRIWAGAGDPNTLLVGQDVKLYDWFINTAASGSNYSVMYQYILQVGNPAWVEVLTLAPDQYGTISSSQFTAGSASISIPISDITEASSYSVDNFMVQTTIEASSPVAHSITTSIASNNLVIDIEGVEYSLGSWSAMSGIYDVHLSINYVTVDGGAYS